MRPNLQNDFGTQAARPAGRTRAEWPTMLMPAAIVTVGHADRPVQSLMGLQCAIARAVQLAADMGRVPAFLATQGVDQCRRLLDVLRAGASVLTHH